MKKILIIEDHTDVRENIAEILDLAGYECKTAANGKIGVQSALDFLPDLVICDIMMPELDGYGVIHILGNRKETKHIPFIFLSAKAEKDDFRKGMNLGADDYLTKPFDEKELLTAIELRLNRRAASTSESTIQALPSEKKQQEELERLFELAEERTYNKKDSLFIEGDRAYFLYYLVSGSVKVFKTNDDGKEAILSIVKPGQFFGYLPMIGSGIYTESASALEKTRTRLIPKAEFGKSLYQHPEIAKMLIEMLVDDVADMEDRLMKMAYNSVRKKVAEALLFVYQKKHHNAGNTPVIHIQRDDLAGIAGTAKETAIRTLAEFREEKLISIEDRNIKILNLKRLEELPN
jgi:CRP/FNR family transcriptional regulator, polysaccharide utilization system transcription regulator